MNKRKDYNSQLSALLSESCRAPFHHLYLHQLETHSTNAMSPIWIRKACKQKQQNHAPKTYIIYYRYIFSLIPFQHDFYIFKIYNQIKTKYSSIHNDKNKVPVPKWMIQFQELDEDPAFPMKKLFEVFLPPLHWRYFQPEAQKWLVLTFHLATKNIPVKTKTISTFL